MKHPEIRFHILFHLYNRHYSDKLEKPQTTDEVIKEAGLGTVDKAHVYGDIIFLQQSKLINGDYSIGTSYPYTVIISNHGIDHLEKIMYQFREIISQSTTIDENTKKKIDDMWAERGASLRFKGVYDYMKDHPELFGGMLAKVLDGAFDFQ